MMLSSNKWIILTVVAGILLANAIDSPIKHLLHTDGTDKQAFSNDKLGITIENLNNKPLSSRQSRNLYPPYQEFGNIDVIQIIDRKSRNNKNLPSTFGSFRFAEGSIPITSSPQPFTKTRRSDEDIGTISTSRFSNDPSDSLKPLDYDYAEDEEALNDNYTLIASSGTIPSEDFGSRKYEYKVIPLSLTVANKKQIDHQEAALSDIVKFPDETHDKDGKNEERLSARRSGIQFIETRQQTRLPFNPFVPQSYSEENSNFGDAITSLQRPFNNEEEVSISRGLLENDNDRNNYGSRYFRDAYKVNADEITSRPTRIEFPSGFRINPIRDEVTKFGDINGPVTAALRTVNDFSEKQHIYSNNPFEQGYYGSTSSENYRPARHYFPPKIYSEYSEFKTNSKYYHPQSTWKSRQPRVVFPQNEFPSATGSIYTNNDNVVFRQVNKINMINKIA